MTKTKTLKLNISERLSALSILNNYKGNLETLSLVLEDIRLFPIDDAEWKKAERKDDTLQEGGGVRTTWNNEKAGDKDIEIHQEVAEVLLKDIQDRDKKGEFTLNDKPYITLLAKLK